MLESETKGIKGLQQGRHSLADRGHDMYETPIEAVRALIAHHPLADEIWEPACGKGAISNPLRDIAGLKVYCSDIVDYGLCGTEVRDFLTYESAPLSIRTIVTNPPFKLSDEFVRHGLRLCDQVIVLLRLAALEGAKRSDIIDGHCTRVLLGKERLPMMHRDGWTGPKTGNSGAPFAWFVFERVKLRKAIQMERISWRV